MYGKEHFPVFDVVYSWGWNNGHLGIESEITAQHTGDYTKVKNVGTPTILHSSALKSRKIRLLASGGSHSALLTDDHKLFTFGRNQNGQLGLGHTKDMFEPTEVHCPFLNPQNRIISIACGDRHTVLVTSNGKAYAFGSNFNGQLGLGIPNEVLAPQLIDMLQSKKCNRVYCGSRHTAFLTESGALYMCGYGLFGQLGQGDNLDSRYPKKIDFLDPVISVSLKEHITVVLTNKYEVFQWGGKTNSEGSDNDVHNKPLKICGTLNGRRVVQVIAAAHHCFARTKDAIFAWGFKLDNLGYVRYLKTLKQKVEEGEIEVFDFEKQIMENQVDMSQKSINESNHKFTIYKIHKFNENIAHAASTNETLFVLTCAGSVYAFGKNSNCELGIGSAGKEFLFPVLIPGLEGKEIARLETGVWSVFALSGKGENQNARDSLEVTRVDDMENEF